MKKYFVLLSLPLMFSCKSGSKEKTTAEDSLTSVNQDMTSKLNEQQLVINSKETAITEFLKSFNEIQSNLNEIKEKEKMVNLNVKSSDLKKSDKDRIISDIQFIYDKMNKNKQNLYTVNKKLKESGIKMEDLETAITNLNNQLVDKEFQIADLKERLENLKVDFSALKVTYQEEKQASDMKTDLLNTAYYAIGETKDLKEKGIINKTGGFIGIGRNTELNDNFKKDDFVRIDLTMLTEIPLNSARKATLVTPHPTDSYKFVMGASYDKLVILDPEKFWSGSKYLVVVVDEKR